MSKVVVMDHPLIEQKIGIIRRKETGTKDFRQNISEIAMLIGYEATKDLKLEEKGVHVTTSGEQQLFHIGAYGQEEADETEAEAADETK